MKSQETCPVCGMDAQKDINAKYQGKTYYFCCQSCKEKFMQNPQQYVRGEPQTATL